MTKTDNQAEVGLHVFERAGLGKAPFRCIGAYEKVFIAYPGAPAKAGGTCDYCGNGIRDVFVIRSADKKEFGVGCDCVRRTGDAGLIKSYKTHPEVRKLNRAKAKALDDKKIAEWNAIMADEAKCAKLSSFSVEKWDKSGDEPWLAFAMRAWKHCGASGRARYLKTAKQLLAS